ncbi:hypothetical protein A1O3_02065 [Capronia epimyces CBS 606.96]|uniref:DnaJ homologue subfamily C member 28 conserved domain-containing protein n=1 Tax=Capronia epimyces CBS 606.96 TaxID=1182542 RepID=W9YIC0_9EURO|nr:uncharacterized protein A1O3_02065 [Capronia epimyces CBS 606.96]EXJ89001.1 hypothetical protein A1O3_02065 [Capronia epimyces CBS 606.96]
MSSSGAQLWTCTRCLRAQRLRGVATLPPSRATEPRRPLSTTPLVQEEEKKPSESKAGQEDGQEQGAMSRRLAEMAEETIDTGSRSDHKLMQDVGFSDELKKQLEERIAQTRFAAENQRAASVVNLPSSAGRGTQDIAGAEPWKGSESLHDSALRMLDDSHKRLRSPYRIPSITQKVDLRPALKKNISAADRLANARDKTSIYALSQQQEHAMSDEEREKWRKELKERFSPGARPMPTTMQGLASLANERIEDAIARGQFKNIPRGKGTNVERDYNANSPFLDTTEYFMNKIIQRQEIVPPWIEKQQDLVKAAANFRGRLRNDWRRHAARMIASTGGSVEDQVRRAKGYALAEERVNPRARKVESLSSISSDGRITSITLEERIAAGVPAERQETVEIDVTETSAESTTSLADRSSNAAVAAATPTPSPINEAFTITTTAEETSTNTATTAPTAVEDFPSTVPSIETSMADPPSSSSSSASTSSPPTSPSSQERQTQPPPPPPVLPMAHPFRDPAWEKTELAYQTLAVQELNALTRSYNLMAPKLAQKPYFTLQRELDRCFADVAPTLADEILERSRKPAGKPAVLPHHEGGVLERFGQGIGAQKYRGHEGRIKDEVEGKGYGFREFWRDLFGSTTSSSSSSRSRSSSNPGDRRGREKGVA